MAGTPSVCGVVDGTLAQIKRPLYHKEQFVDRKGHHHSLNVTLVAGRPQLQFTYCSVQRDQVHQMTPECCGSVMCTMCLNMGILDLVVALSVLVTRFTQRRAGSPSVMQKED